MSEIASRVKAIIVLTVVVMAVEVFSMNFVNFLMQWCVDNDFCAEAARAVQYDSDFIWEGESWPEAEYIISEKDRNSVRLENFCGR